MSGMISQFLAGTWVTIQLAVCSLLLGLFLGILGALAKLSLHAGLKASAIVITSFIRGIPELVMLFFIYYGANGLLALVWGEYIEVSAFIAGTIALGLIFASYATEVLRGAYLCIPYGQMQAAIAYGFNDRQAFLRIMLPQIWSHALPGLGNLWFVLLKDTALVALIGASDIMRVAQGLTAYTHQPFTFYLTAAMIYLCLTTLSMFAQKKLECRVNHYQPKD
jgi:His/Glu/Gln/Arg/opine family amino acid ABC transporter permease subunit